MSLCECGCGGETRKDARFLGGHYAKWKAKQPKKEVTAESKMVTESSKKTSNTMYYLLIFIFVVAGIVQYFLWSWLKMHWVLLLIFYVIDFLILVFLLWTIYRLRKKQEPIIFKDLEEFIKEVPKWAIDDKSPKDGVVGKFVNAGKDYKQLILVSTHFEPKAVWAEWDGFMFRIGNRAYIPPRDVRGDVFIYHVDKKIPLIDSAEATSKDAEDSYHLLAVWNQAFSVGHNAALSETQSQIKIIMVIVAAIAVMVLALGIYTYGQFSAINEALESANRAITNYIEAHP